ncbi:MAG: M20 family metallopeptidase [Bacteroidota bacterium]|nr:M20 family metallopeptidase [Bacteroidota bacterium]
MIFEDVISLTRKLISFNTVNPDGNEEGIARFVGKLLSQNGFTVNYHQLAQNRLTVIAKKGLSGEMHPLVMTGHFDTVPIGAKQWNEDPLSGTIKEGKIYGRGSSDMKGGVAAMICAAVQAFQKSVPLGGIRLIFTAGEEPGCLGAVHLAETGYNLGKASAIIVGEPTSNVPAIGHKGALYLKVSVSGKTAHSSMPELGDNAIYKAARAITKIENFRFRADRNELHGFPTINVGLVSGGKNLNSVPDHAEFTIDIRSTGKVTHAEILERLSQELGKEVTIEKLVDLPPVSSSELSPFVQLVYSVCDVNPDQGVLRKSLPYMTDGAVLQQLYDGVPTIILGPGQPEMAHQTDEFCYVDKIEEAVEIYKNIILKYGGITGDKIS